MDYLNSKNIHSIQLDITSFCNSFCGSCIRNINGGEVNPNIKLSHFDFEIWKQIINSETFSNTESLTFNGNFGDFTSHPKFVEMLTYLSKIRPDLTLLLNTNGGARDTEFWKDLAVVLNNFSNHELVFSIDGLEDTNHIYRRGVEFKKIIKNATTFIKHGGNASWRMIVFDYNKHQLSEASEYARDLGFKKFRLNRSFSTEIYAKSYKEFAETRVTAPNSTEVKQLSIKFNWSVYDGLKGYKNVYKLDNACPWQVERRIQVDPWGNVWPCCYMSQYHFKINSPKYKFINDSKKIYGENFNSLYSYSLDAIINSEFMQKHLHKNMASRNIEVCNKFCHAGTTL
jgi:MoaA/NifB/PqqE/SkfB family radical SAM enzyme